VRHQLHVRVDPALPGPRDLLEVRPLFVARAAGHGASASAEDQTRLAGDPLFGAVIEKGLKRLGAGRVRACVVAVEREDCLALGRRAGRAGRGPRPWAKRGKRGGPGHCAQEAAARRGMILDRHGTCSEKC